MMLTNKLVQFKYGYVNKHVTVST